MTIDGPSEVTCGLSFVVVAQVNVAARALGNISKRANPPPPTASQALSKARRATVY